jgi:nicotinamidase-related amidase
VLHIERDRCALVLVDYQQRLMPTIHDAGSVVDEALFLGEMARLLGVRAIGTEQNPGGLGPNVEAVRALCARTLPKMHFDACRDGLVAALGLPDSGARGVVIAGCEAHVCLCQTALGLLEAGLTVRVVAEACGSRRPSDHALAMQRLAAAGATIVGSEMVAFEWLGTCEDAAFKGALRLLKRRAAAQAAAR